MKITGWVCSFWCPCIAFSDAKTPGNNCKWNSPFKGRSIAFIFYMIRKGSSSSWLLIMNKDIAFFNLAIFNLECLFQGLSWKRFGSKPSVSGVTGLDFITASSPKDGSDSSCTSKANPSGFLGFVDLPIPLLCSFFYYTANFWWKTPQPPLTVLSEGRDVRILLALVSGFMWFLTLVAYGLLVL